MKAEHRLVCSAFCLLPSSFCLLPSAFCLVMMVRPQLDTLDEYRQRFFDAAYWSPYVRVVCERHGLAPCRSIESRVPGTCPVFIVDERWVVKFFGRLFEGGRAFEVERAANQIAAQDSSLVIPKLVAQGSLYEAGDDWHWPYLIFDYVPSVSLSQVYDEVSLEDKLAVAREVGYIARRLHALPLPDETPLPPTWDAFVSVLEESRQDCAERLRENGAVPAHLIDQVDRYLLPASELVDQTRLPSLIHGDLTADHVLGRTDADGHWRMRALIDFGDALAGDPAYDLVALHADLFRCDKRLLRAYLDAYGDNTSSPGPSPGFARKAMCMTLLHRFGPIILEMVMRREPAARASTLEELAALLWDTQDEAG